MVGTHAVRPWACCCLWDDVWDGVTTLEVYLGAKPALRGELRSMMVGCVM